MAMDSFRDLVREEVASQMKSFREEVMQLANEAIMRAASIAEERSATTAAESKAKVDVANLETSTALVLRQLAKEEAIELARTDLEYLTLSQRGTSPEGLGPIERRLVFYASSLKNWILAMSCTIFAFVISCEILDAVKKDDQNSSIVAARVAVRRAEAAEVIAMGPLLAEGVELAPSERAYVLCSTLGRNSVRQPLSADTEDPHEIVTSASRDTSVEEIRQCVCLLVPDHCAPASGPSDAGVGAPVASDAGVGTPVAPPEIETPH